MTTTPTQNGNTMNDRFEFEDFPVPPMPAPADLPELPPRPDSGSNRPSRPGRYPSLIGRADTISDEDFARYNELLGTFRSSIDELPRLRDHFLRSHAGGGTPGNPYAICWGSMRVTDFKSVRAAAVNLDGGRAEYKDVEQAIKRIACFAIYHKEQAPDCFRMPDDVFKSYAEAVWVWTQWLTSVREE